jgi:hypothetical protein
LIEMAAAATNGNGNARLADRDEATDRRVLARMLEMRDQGYSFRDIAAALAKQRLIVLSPEHVKAVLEAHQILYRKE